MQEKLQNSLKPGIIGAGGWGTALSTVLSKNFPDILIWAIEPEVSEEINIKKSNSVFLKDVTLPNNVSATNDLNEFADRNLLIFSVPTQFLRSVLKKIEFPMHDKIIVNVAKGIEQNSLMRISEMFSDVKGITPEQYTILTGPSHAEEVARLSPTTVVAASEEHNNEKLILQSFSLSHFRVYSSDDVVGCEIGGALKNVIAIAAGIVDGLGMGDNTKAALITRGLAEMSRLGVALGANQMTFSGLSGLGDLFVTCNSRHSRNRFIGEQIGKGRKIGDIINEMQMIAEGINTTESAYQLAMKHDVELPIVHQVYGILFEDVDPRIAIQNLMNRSSKREWWW